MMVCRVTRLKRPPRIDARWDKAPWRGMAPQRIGRHMGLRPEHRPKTEVKLAYDADALYAIFRVEDRYVRAVAPRRQSAVCRDSCVEFFFSPSPDASAGYFNLEMNCGGTLLFRFQRRPGKGVTAIPPGACRRIEIAHSLPRIVRPERQAPTTWTVEYRLPFELLRGYCPAIMPAPGVTWRANFYKCADRSSHPHWLTWAPVAFPRPNFHLPAFFGTLEFR